MRVIVEGSSTHLQQPGHHQLRRQLGLMAQAARLVAARWCFAFYAAQDSGQGSLLSTRSLEEELAARLPTIQRDDSM